MEKIRKMHRERIMSDWRSCLPAMRQFKSMTLMKRNGPIVTGLYLQENRDNTWYKVIPYVHNLSRQKNVVTHTLDYALRNKRNDYLDFFTLKAHDREFSDACKRLHNQTLFPLTRDLSLTQIIAAYESFIDRNLGVSAPTFLYEDIISLFAWYGKLSEAKRRLGVYTKIMNDWEEWIFRHVGGKIAFFDRLVDIVEMPHKLEEICEQQIELLKLKKIPDYGLGCS